MICYRLFSLLLVVGEWNSLDLLFSHSLFRSLSFQVIIKHPFQRILRSYISLNSCLQQNAVEKKNPYLNCVVAKSKTRMVRVNKINFFLTIHNLLLSNECKAEYTKNT